MAGVRIDDPLPILRATSQRLDACRRAIDNTALGLNHTTPLVALHDLGNHDVAPGTQPRPPARARGHGVAQGLTNGPDVSTQPIRTDQQWTGEGTAPDALDQAADQRHVALLADFSAQPQPGLH